MGLGVYKIFQTRAPDDLDRGWAGLLMFYPEALDSVHSYTCVLNLAECALLVMGQQHIQFRLIGGVAS